MELLEAVARKIDHVIWSEFDASRSKNQRLSGDYRKKWMTSLQIAHEVIQLVRADSSGAAPPS